MELNAGDVISGISAAAVAASAAVTAMMAHWTRKAAEAALSEAQAVSRQGQAVELQAKATSEQAELTRRSLEATVQPWLILAEEQDFHVGGNPSFVVPHPPLTVRLHKHDLVVDIKVRNVGAGLAIIDSAGSAFIGWPDRRSTEQDPMPFNPGMTLNPVVPSGEQAVMSYTIPLECWNNDFDTITNRHANNGEFFLEIAYSDGVGLGSTTVRFHITHVGHRDSDAWRVHQASYLRRDDTQPAIVATYAPQSR
jgi:hypothetical protein